MAGVRIAETELPHDPRSKVYAEVDRIAREFSDPQLFADECSTFARRVSGTEGFYNTEREDLAHAVCNRLWHIQGPVAAAHVVNWVGYVLANFDHMNVLPSVSFEDSWVRYAIDAHQSGSTFRTLYDEGAGAVRVRVPLPPGIGQSTPQRAKDFADDLRRSSEYGIDAPDAIRMLPEVIDESLRGGLILDPGEIWQLDDAATRTDPSFGRLRAEARWRAVGLAAIWPPRGAPGERDLQVSGWKPDPGLKHELRYWDTEDVNGWTDHVSDSGATDTEPLQPFAVGFRPLEGDHDVARFLRDSAAMLDIRDADDPA